MHEILTGSSLDAVTPGDPVAADVTLYGRNPLMPLQAAVLRTIEETVAAGAGTAGQWDLAQLVPAAINALVDATSHRLVGDTAALQEQVRDLVHLAALLPNPESMAAELLKGLAVRLFRGRR